MRARIIAKKMIEPYVERGDSLESLEASKMGMSSDGYDVSIGGYCHTDFGTDDAKTHKLRKGEIGVVLDDSRLYKFKLKDLFMELTTGKVQMVLF